MKPRLVLTLGDPSGVGPELMAKLLADPQVCQAAELYVVASREEFLRGQQIAGVEVAFTEATSIDLAQFGPGLPVLQHVPARIDRFEHGIATAESGRHCLETLGIALDLASQGAVDAICFAPLNKEALHAGGNPFEDELHWFADRLAIHTFISEINVLDGVWTSRVSSHIPMKDAAAKVTAERVRSAIDLIDASLKSSGTAAPRIVVCGFNPHAGEGGLLGQEEIEVIQPAVAAARASGQDVEGPFPADSVFIKVRRGDYDAVVTMYHDQGQIALKLMGFERGVTVQGGLPVPITTPSHGTAFDIVGKNLANVSTLRHAFDLACVLASRSQLRAPSL